MARKRGDAFHQEHNFPQLGAGPERYEITAKSGEPKLTAAGNPKTAIRFGSGGIDLETSVHHAAAIQNFAHSLRTADPATVQRGMQWYPKVNEAVTKGIAPRGRNKGFLSAASDKTLSGAAIVAAVSPNMDWDAANIHAFGEIRGLRSEHWKAIMGGTKSESASAVAGLSISRAPRGNLQKVGRLIEGESPHEVIPQKTAPKTHAFFHNIAEPSNPHHVTIDARAYDTITNRQRPWTYNRMLTTRPSGREQTRYGQAQSIVQGVAAGAGLDPSAAQAIAWEHVKYNIEQGGLTNKGTKRKQGSARVGQPYFHPVTGEPVAHMSGQFNGA